MKSKIFSLVVLSILSLVMLVSFASAATIFTDDFNDGDLSGWTATGWANEGTQAVSTDEENAFLYKTISTEGYENIVVSYERQLGDDWESDNNFTVSWSADGTNFNVLEGVTGDDDPNDSDFISKSFSSLATSANDNSNFQLRFECSTDAQAEFCNLDNISVEGTAIPTSSEEPEEITECELTGDNGNLRVKIDDINVKGFGDDSEWFPLDEIEVEIEVENKGDEKIKDIVVGWGLYDLDEEDWVIDDEEDDFDLKDGDEETLTVTFELEDPDDFEDNGNYIFYVWATGEDEEFDGDETCVSDSEDIEIVLEDDWVVLTGFEYLDTASCGDSLTLTAEVWNIGDDDQDEVSVVIYNNELGYSKIVEIGDIDAFENEALNAVIEIPNDADEKQYIFKFEVRDEDNDIYENDFDDEESVSTIVLNVGECVTEPKALVTASLESGGEAGEELVVKVVITNTGDESATYTLNAAGYAEWASSAEISQRTFTLNKGDSKEVLITFNVDKDAAGTKLFDLELVSGNELVSSQPVSVSIEESKGFSLPGDFSYIWLIGALNIILVIIIVVVAIRLAKR